MISSNPLSRWLLAAILLGSFAARSEATVFATYDAAVHNATGFEFGDFNDFFAFDSTGGDISLDINNDLDLANGLFGGAGSDVGLAIFDAATSQIVVNLTVDPLNVASGFNVVLLDNDGVNTGEEYQYFFSLSGVPTGQPVTLTQSLVSPGPVFRQAAFNQTDGDMVQNYGLTQIQIQSLFNGADRLKIDLQNILIEGSGNPVLPELTTATFAAAAQDFSFGTFSEPGVLDATGPNFVINTNLAADPAAGGGLGFNGLNIPFDATQYEIQIEARLLAGNTADSFNLLMGDVDGDDSGPGLGSEDYLFTVDTSNFNTSTFSTFTIPLGSGSESGFVTTFGFTNGGDGLQNFGLSQLQIQVNGMPAMGSGAGLAIEIARFSIVERSTTVVQGDFNADGVVDAADYTVWRDNLGGDASALNGNGTGAATVVQADYDLWKANFGGAAIGGALAANVPEGVSSVLLLVGVLSVAAFRRAA